MARRVGNDPDGDRDCNSGSDHRRQNPHLASGTFLVRHLRILHPRRTRCNPYFAANLAG
jgi:hypothetical protein